MQIATGGRVSPFVLSNKRQTDRPTTWTQWSHISRDAPPLMVHFGMAALLQAVKRQQRHDLGKCRKNASSLMAIMHCWKLFIYLHIISFKIWQPTVIKQAEKQSWRQLLIFISRRWFFSFSENPSVVLCSRFCFPSSLFSLSLPAEGSHSLRQGNIFFYSSHKRIDFFPLFFTPYHGDKFAFAVPLYQTTPAFDCMSSGIRCYIEIDRYKNISSPSFSSPNQTNPSLRQVELV